MMASVTPPATSRTRKRFRPSILSGERTPDFSISPPDHHPSWQPGNNTKATQHLHDRADLNQLSVTCFGLEHVSHPRQGLDYTLIKCITSPGCVHSCVLCTVFPEVFQLGLQWFRESIYSLEEDRLEGWRAGERAQTRKTLQ